LKRPANPPMLTLRLNPKAACPLYRQIYNELRRAIVERKLPAGARLPSTRVFARALGVSRNTILNAYESLVAEALIVARKGSGTRVAAPSEKMPTRIPTIRPAFDLWAAQREALFPATSAYLNDPEGNPVYVHR
jgi:GntR family transcriptional regulator / MocR family aminotransferase